MIRERLLGGATVTELRESYAADTSLAHEERTAALAILFQKQQEAERPADSPAATPPPDASEPEEPSPQTTPAPTP